GTTAAFAGRWGRLAPSEGRLFSREGEAVVGKDVRLAIGEAFTPSHGLPARRGAARAGREGEALHRHEGVRYSVVRPVPRLRAPMGSQRGPGATRHQPGSLGLAPRTMVCRVPRPAPPPAGIGRRWFATARWEVYGTCR